MAVERELQRGGFPSPGKDDWATLARSGPPVDLHRLDSDGLLRQLLYTDSPAGCVIPQGANALSVAQPRQRVAHPDVQVAAEWLRSSVDSDITSVAIQVAGDRGLKLRSAGDIAVLLNGLPLERCALHWQAGSHTLGVVAAACAAARSSETGLSTLQGGWGYDPLSSLAAEGTLLGGYRGGLSRLVDLAAWSRRTTPMMKAFRVDTSPYHAACATDVMELGWSLSHGMEYLRALHEAKVSAAEAMRQAEIHISVGTDFLSGVAKLRALRLLWARALQAIDPDAAEIPIWVHAECSRRGHSTLSAHTNMLRATTQAIAATCGQADSLTVPSFDTLDGYGGAMGRRVARNVHHILNLEAGLHQVADPGAGSHAIESVTHQLAEAAWSEFQSIESRGGAAACLADGHFRRRAKGRRLTEARDFGRGQMVTVGVTHFAVKSLDSDDDASVNLREVEYQLGRPLPGQDNSVGDTRAAMVALSTAEREEGFGVAIDGASMGLSIAELSAGLVSGLPSLHIEPLPASRLAAEIEDLRGAIASWSAMHEEPLEAAIVTLGTPDEQHGTRQGVARSTLQRLGVPVRLENVASTDALIEWSERAGVRLMAILGDDKALSALREPHLESLAHNGIKGVFLVDPVASVSMHLARHASFLSLRSDGDLVLQARDLLVAAGVVR